MGVKNVHRCIIITVLFLFLYPNLLDFCYNITYLRARIKFTIKFTLILHRETFYINFHYSIFQSREKRTTLIIFVSKNNKLYNNDMKL